MKIHVVDNKVHEIILGSGYVITDIYNAHLNIEQEAKNVNLGSTVKHFASGQVITTLPATVGYSEKRYEELLGDPHIVEVHKAPDYLPPHIKAINFKAVMPGNRVVFDESKTFNDEGIKQISEFVPGDSSSGITTGTLILKESVEHLLKSIDIDYLLNFINNEETIGPKTIKAMNELTGKKEKRSEINPLDHVKRKVVIE